MFQNFTRKLLLLLFISVIHLSAYSKTTDKDDDDFFDGTWIEADITGSTKSHDTKPMSIGFGWGFDISKRLYICLREENIICLYDNEEKDNTYIKTRNLGGAVGYSFYLDKDEDNYVLNKFDIRAQITNSVGKVDLKNTAYSVGLYFRHKYRCTRFENFFGIGFRHINSHTSGIKNHNGVYAVFGIRY